MFEINNMSLDISKLENVKEKHSHIRARCPACAEQGHDHKGNHLSIDEQGRFTCVLYPGEGGKCHRKRIFELTGIKGHMKKSIKIKVPKCKLNQNKTSLFTDSDNHNLGRLGRVNHTRGESAVICKNILGRLGRLFITPPYIDLKKNNNNKKEYEIAVPAVPNETEGDCHATPTKSIDETMNLDQTAWPPPYINKSGTLVIPFNSDPKYHWWNGGQSIRDTLRELGASDEIIRKYKSPYSDN